MSTTTGSGNDPVEKAHDEFAESLIGKKIAGRYVVESILGTGGMGLVAAATYPELDQPVAVKFMWPEHSAHHVLAARFTREAKLAARVKSPHLVKVFDVGTLDGGVPYLVMEHLEGHDLGREVHERRELPVDEVVDWILQAATGLAEIHAQGIVHRDLKPSNLFLADSNGATTLKVLDFGISKDKGTSKATTLTAESVLGTPFYMSPEQIKDPRDVDPRSDLWSLGVILYELLTHELPFVGEGDSVGELFGRILFTEPTPPRRVRPDLPDGLDDVIMKCLQRARDDRYVNVAELAEALRPYASPASAHRIDAIAKALKHDPMSGRELVAGDAKRNTPPRAPSSERDPGVSRAATAIAGKGATPARSAPPVSGGNASTQSTWGTKAKLPTKSRAWLLIGAGGAIVVAIAAFFGWKNGNDAKKATTADVARTAEPPAAATTSAPPAVSLVPTTVLLPVTPPSAASSAPAPTPTPTAVTGARPAATAVTARPTVTARTTATTAPAASTKPPELILDRK